MTVIEVAIGPGGAPGMFKVEVVASPAGEASATVELDAESLLARRGLLQQAVLASAVPSRRVLPETEQPVREAGQVLFAGLLGTGEVAGRYRAAAAVAAERGEGLRVVLRIDTPALAGLPWEAMYDQAAGAYVCRQDQLVRHVPVASVPAPLRVRPPLRILGVVSSPRGLPPLDVEKEQDQLARALARPAGQGLAELHWAPSATWADLQDLLLDGEWHVLHFIGHGDFDPGRDEGVLALVREDGRADLVAAHRLTDLLRQARPMPRLVVLNSCSGAAAGVSDLFSGTAAALVRGGVSAVAAMQYEISDPAAVAFARGFYAAIARGRGVDDAVSSGRVAILGLSDRTLEWVTPVLYLRGHDTRLFTLPAPAEDTNREDTGSTRDVDGATAADVPGPEPVADVAGAVASPGDGEQRAAPPPRDDHPRVATSGPGPGEKTPRAPGPRRALWRGPVIISTAIGIAVIVTGLVIAITTISGTPSTSARWTYTTADAVSSSPAVAGGTVYVGSGQQGVRAGRRHRPPPLDLHHRRHRQLQPGGGGRHRLRRQRRPQGVRAGRRHRPPPLDLHHRRRRQLRPGGGGRHRLRRQRDRKVYALDAATGRPRWTYTTGGYRLLRPGGGGRHRLRRQRRPQGVRAGRRHRPPPLDLHHRRRRRLRARRWRAAPSTSAATTARCTRWTPPPAAPAGPTPPEAPSTPARRWRAAPSTSAASDRKVYALDAATGRPRWTYTTGGAVTSGPAVAGGTVYVGSYDRKVYALDAATGRPRWTYTTGGVVDPARRWRAAPSTSAAATTRCTRWTPGRKHQARRSPQSRRGLPVPAHRPAAPARGPAVSKLEACLPRHRTRFPRP